MKKLFTEEKIIQILKERKAVERRRFGYRRIHVLLEREGIQVNSKKLRRIYSEENLHVKRRDGRE